MFLKLVVRHCGKSSSKFESQKHELVIEELKDMSKEPWFVGDDPMEFDKRRSNAPKASFSSGIKEEDLPKGIEYCHNCIQRL